MYRDRAKTNYLKKNIKKDCLNSTRKRYKRLLNKVLSDPDTVFELQRIKSFLSGVTSEQSINDVVLYKYQVITLKYFPQEKKKRLVIWPLRY